MATPIAVLYVPEDVWNNQVVGNHIRALDNFKEQIPEYYWLIFPDYETQKLYLQVFYEKDFTEIQYSELLELVTKKFDEIKNKQDA